MAAAFEIINLDHINNRVDEALTANRRTENIVVVMACGIFLLGIAVIILGYWYRNPYIVGPAVLFQGLLYWPIREILKLRRENLALQTVPVIVSTLPPQDWSREIKKMLQFLRGGKP